MSQEERRVIEGFAS